uniref:Gfo/Idh/MocA-like oxidoreductase N-terminal domain-containing protein n=1 Tax=Globisporangium ultimum (strain ATCC 200006 / CBS 805.95 / DAOM BR144) TaxID=431595 RepID=K3WJ44_GLOUD
MALWNLLRPGGRRTATATLHHHAISTRAMSRLNVAVVGTGRMGKIRLAGIQSDPRLKVAGIIDPITTASATEKTAWESQFQTKVFADVASAAQELESDGVGIDGLWIATPTPSHLPVIQDSLTSASTSFAKLKAIGVEKPVGGTLEDIDRAYKLCSDKRVQLFCSFQRRFDPSYEALRRACVDNAQLGKLQSIHTVFRDHPCPPIEFLKTGGDPFHDLAVHDIDYVCTLVGEYPTKVYAFGTSLSPELREVNVMDKASVWLEFPNSGVICTMDLSRSALYGYDQRVEVSGEKGMLQVVNPPKTSLVRASADGITSDVLSHSFPERFREAYVLEMDAFVDVLTGTRPPIVHWNAARMATIISEAARIAAVEKKVVTIQYGKTKQNSPNSDPHIEYEYVY